MANYKNLDVDDSLLGMLRHMQAVQDCREELNNLQSIWDNLTLLGQLSGTGADMNSTRQSFQKLTGTLLNQLTAETLRTCLLEMTSKAQVAIDILVRNLFERTADIGFLATDADIINILNLIKYNASDSEDKSILDAAKTKLKERFAEYLAKYSVYSDIVLLDTNGSILLRLKDYANIEKTHHPLLTEALTTTTGYVETYDKIDFLPDENRSLVYSFRVGDNENQPLAVLCLCFRFENEMQRIFTDLVPTEDWTVITLLDSEGRVIASSDTYHIALGVVMAPVLDQEYHIQRFAGQEYLAASRRSIGYQGYAGPLWHAHVLLPLQHAFNRNISSLLKTIPQERLDTVMERSQLFGEILRSIPQQANRIQRELNRSVWNGNVRQSRTGHTKENMFSKVLLWEISNTGARTQAVFQRSIANLHETVVSSILEDSRFQASLAIDIMDRNLYERANDCRWWALTSTFAELLAETEVSDAAKEKISSILIYINSLYTVYSNLFVFDLSGRILAVSNSNEAYLIGQNVGEEWYKRVLLLPNTQAYAVSDFVETRFYKGLHTYIYGAAIRSLEDERIVGGIGIVFDSAPQFSAMLRDALPKDSDGQIDIGAFGVFVSPKGQVLACSDQRFNPGDKLNISTNLSALQPGKNLIDVSSLNGSYYAIGAHASSGYREYKSEQDSYKNAVIALVAKELCPISNENRLEAVEPPCPSIRSEHGKDGRNVEIATFRLGEEWFGIRASQILEAVDTAHISPAPGAGAECVGYLTYEKLPIPVFDIRTIVCFAQNQLEALNPKAQQVIVLEKDPSTRYGIIADSLGEIPEVDESRLNALPPMLGGSALLADVAITPDKPHDESLLLVLNNLSLAQRLASGMNNDTEI